jgi:ABC-2 type transport system permease protein
MKRFIGFLRKEFYHIFRDKRTLVILFGMPVAQIMLFGFAITNEIKNAKIGILDLSKDPVTRAIRDKMLSSGYFTLYKELHSRTEIEPIFRSGEVKEVIVFGPGFSERLIREGSADLQVIADATDPNTASALVSYTGAIVNDYLRTVNESKQPPMRVVTEIRMMYNPELKSVFLFVPGLITIILMLVSAMLTSISITREKELGTMEVLMVSPLTPMPIILGKVLPYLLLSIVNTIVILLLGYFVFRIPFAGNLAMLMAECILFIVTALSLGILISTVTQSQQTAMMISMAGLMLPTIMLSGFIFPVESMPVALQWISNIIPARWFIHIIKDIMLKGVGPGYLWKETLVLAGMTGVFIFLSYLKFKMRLDES